MVSYVKISAFTVGTFELSPLPVHLSLCLLAILPHFLNQTSNKMEFSTINILNLVHSPGAVYIPKQTFFSVFDLLATNDSTTKTLKLIPFGEGRMYVFVVNASCL